MKSLHDSDAFADWYLGVMLVVLLLVLTGGTWALLRTTAALAPSFHEIQPALAQHALYSST